MQPGPNLDMLSPALRARFDAMIAHYPVKRSALVPMLLYAQDELGHLTPEVIRGIAARLELDELAVREVIGYYSMLRLHPAGRYHVQVCTNISCQLRGADRIWDHCRARLQLENHQTTPDGVFRSKKSNASAPVPGRRRCRSTTIFTSSSRLKKWIKSSMATAGKAPPAIDHAIIIGSVSEDV